MNNSEKNIFSGEIFKMEKLLEVATIEKIINYTEMPSLAHSANSTIGVSSIRNSSVLGFGEETERPKPKNSGNKIFFFCVDGDEDDDD